MNTIDRLISGRCYIGDEISVSRLYGGFIGNTVVIHHVSKETTALNRGTSDSTLDMKTPFYYPFEMSEYFLIRTTSDADEKSRWRNRSNNEPVKTLVFLKIDEVKDGKIAYTLKYEETFEN